jgi:hypothetical protein
MTVLNIKIKTCSHAGCDSEARQKGKSKLGFPVYTKYCTTHYRVYYDKQYRLYKKDKCEMCGFVPKHPCQLDVDHKDGSKKNNSVENLQTLCANCHRLKTYIHKDYIKRQPN